jgi:outer membrane protein OmpA-like peptidoglycan-associated protein
MNRIAYGIAVVVASLLFALPAFANPDAKDCTDYPGVSRMGTFFIDNCNRKQFESARFWVGPKDKEVQQNQEGRYFHYDYESNSGAPGASMVQIIRNYQNAVRAAGGQVMSDRMGTNWADTSLKLNKAGKEIWVLVEAHDNSYQLTIVEKQPMHQDVVVDLKALGETGTQASKAARPDAKGCKDFPGITRLSNFYIDSCDYKQFESAKFWVGGKDKEAAQQQEGRYAHLAYELGGTPGASMLQIVRNYQNAVKASGGQVMSDRMGTNWADTSLKLNKAGKEIWVLVEAHDNSYQLTIVEKQGMQQEVTMDAKAMGDTISQTGKVAIYGIYFDFAKANLKPESEPALNQIATLLKQNPKLNVYIVGHTDMVGDAATNVRLSQERAQSVIAALAGRYAIAPARLKPFGAGSYAPVASNRTDEGRAKNRRVELVEIAMK